MPFLNISGQDITQISTCLQIEDFKVHKWVSLQQGKLCKCEVENPSLIDLRQKYPTLDFNSFNELQLSKIKLIAFDFDSTLVQSETIDELGKLAGKANLFKEITQAAMEGKIEFPIAFKQRISLLKGLPEANIKQIYPKLKPFAGFASLVSLAKTKKIILVCISGGFTFAVDYFLKPYQFDYFFANQLVFQDGLCTGEICNPLIDKTAKAQILRDLALKLQLPLEEVLAVGDGANDVEMLSTSGIGCAFHAKPILEKVATLSLRNSSYDILLSF